MQRKDSNGEITSEMIHHHGASLSKQQTTHNFATLLIWHTAGFVTVDQHIHVAKCSEKTAMVKLLHVCHAIP